MTQTNRIGNAPHNPIETPDEVSELSIKIAYRQWQKLQQMKQEITSIVQKYQQRSSGFSFFKLPNGLGRLNRALNNLPDDAIFEPFKYALDALSFCSVTHEGINKEEVSEDEKIWNGELNSLIEKYKNKLPSFYKIADTINSIDHHCKLILSEKISTTPTFGTRNKETANLYERNYAMICPEENKQLSSKLSILQELKTEIKRNHKEYKLGHRWLFLPKKQPHHMKMIHHILKKMPEQSSGHGKAIFNLWSGVQTCLARALIIHSEEINNMNLKEPVVSFWSEKKTPIRNSFGGKREYKVQKWYEDQFKKFTTHTH